MEKNKKQPLFSIITVSFNSERTVERTIKSVLSQSFADYEYLIIDGDSSDNTMNIVKQYEESFGGRLKYLSEPDSGIYNAMNKGIHRATGKIIGIVNSDDWLEPDALQTVNEYVGKAENPLNSIYCGWMYFHYKSGDNHLMTTSVERLNSLYAKRKIGVRHPATFVSSLIYKDLGVFDENLRILADTDFMLRAKKAGANFIFIDKPVTNMSDGGISNNIKHIKLKYKDHKKVYAKHSTSKMQYYKLLLPSVFVMFAKVLLSEKAVKLIRKRKK